MTYHPSIEQQLRETDRSVELGRPIFAAAAHRVFEATMNAYRERDESLLMTAPRLTGILGADAVRLVGVTHVVGFMTCRQRCGHLKLSTKDSAFDTTFSFLERSKRLERGDLNKIEKKYRTQVFKHMGQVSDKATKKASEIMASVVKRNLPTKSGVKLLSKELNKAGLTPENASRLETAFRTQTQIAFNAGRWEAAKIPAVADILWGWEYVTVGDDRVRPNHEAMDGARYPTDDPIWLSIWPPNGYNCRCATLEIFDDDPFARTKKVKPVEIDGKLVAPEPDKGWDLNFAEVLNEALE